MQCDVEAAVTAGGRRVGDGDALFRLMREGGLHWIWGVHCPAGKGPAGGGGGAGEAWASHPKTVVVVVVVVVLRRRDDDTGECSVSVMPESVPYPHVLRDAVLRDDDAGEPQGLPYPPLGCATRS